jgi:hypothetical protein
MEDQPSGRKGQVMPNQITGSNAGGPRQLPIQKPLAARVGQFTSEVIRQADSYDFFAVVRGDLPTSI